MPFQHLHAMWKTQTAFSAKSLKGQAQLASWGLDCAIVGCAQEGTPVAELASWATKELFSASSAAFTLGIWGFDVVVKQARNATKEAKEAVQMAQELDVEASQMAPELDFAHGTSEKNGMQKLMIKVKMKRQKSRLQTLSKNHQKGM